MEQWRVNVNAPTPANKFGSLEMTLLDMTGRPKNPGSTEDLIANPPPELDAHASFAVHTVEAALEQTGSISQTWDAASVSPSGCTFTSTSNNSTVEDWSFNCDYAVGGFAAPNLEIAGHMAVREPTFQEQQAGQLYIPYGSYDEYDWVFSEMQVTLSNAELATSGTNQYSRMVVGTRTVMYGSDTQFSFDFSGTYCVDSSAQYCGHCGDSNSFYSAANEQAQSQGGAICVGVGCISSSGNEYTHPGTMQGYQVNTPSDFHLDGSPARFDSVNRNQGTDGSYFECTDQGSGAWITTGRVGGFENTAGATHSTQIDVTFAVVASGAASVTASAVAVVFAAVLALLML
jgi:hypothetical protein